MENESPKITDAKILLTLPRKMDDDLKGLKNNEHLKNQLCGSLTKQKLIRHSISKMVEEEKTIKEGETA